MATRTYTNNITRARTHTRKATNQKREGYYKNPSFLLSEVLFISVKMFKTTWRLTGNKRPHPCFMYNKSTLQDNQVFHLDTQCHTRAHTYKQTTNIYNLCVVQTDIIHNFITALKYLKHTDSHKLLPSLIWTLYDWKFRPSMRLCLSLYCSLEPYKTIYIWVNVWIQKKNRHCHLLF